MTARWVEELLADDEATPSTAHPKVRVASAGHLAARLDAGALAWLTSDDWLDDQAVRRALARWVPEYAAAQATSPLAAKVA